jgi:hypothetical protein
VTREEGNRSTLRCFIGSVKERDQLESLDVDGMTFKGTLSK